MVKIWKSDFPDKLKRNFFKAIVESITIYGSISWTFTCRNWNMRLMVHVRKCFVLLLTGIVGENESWKAELAQPDCDRESNFKTFRILWATVLTLKSLTPSSVKK